MIRSRTIVIAEAGVNHNGSIDLAKKLVDVAADAGADYVKFQTFKAEKLVSLDAQQADYQKANYKEKDQSQFSMLKKLELSESMHYELIDYCHAKGIKFLSTAFDLESIDFLDSVNIDLFKIPSGEITNRPYLEKIGSLGKKVILSTGMSTLVEIKQALNVILESGTKIDDITILHCNTEYPTPYKDVHLNAMKSIGETFNVNHGYSDHTNGIEVAIAAVALGATVVEKHFTTNKSLDGPDHKASLEPSELKDMIKAIRNIELALGSNKKQPSPSERKNLPIARKSIHLAQSQKAGHIIEFGDLVMKRPGDGISPMKYISIIGKEIKRDLVTDHKLNWEDIK